jgi:hypothetical protein
MPRDRTSPIGFEIAGHDFGALILGGNPAGGMMLRGGNGRGC